MRANSSFVLGCMHSKDLSSKSGVSWSQYLWIELNGRVCGLSAGTEAELVQVSPAIARNHSICHLLRVGFGHTMGNEMQCLAV
jgi:hypothetical protein